MNFLDSLIKEKKDLEEKLNSVNEVLELYKNSSEINKKIELNFSNKKKLQLK